jgi:hypothetical protein
MTGALHVGRGGGVGSTGTLKIYDGGLVKVGGILYIDPYNQSSAAYVQMSDNGKLALYGNAAGSITDFLGLVVGSDNITYWNGSAWSNITNGFLGTDYTLAAGTGDLTGYTVLTVPEPATVSLLAASALGILASRRRK